MNALSALLLFIGSALIVGGAAAITWPAGLIAAGVLLVLAAIDLRGTQ